MGNMPSLARARIIQGSSAVGDGKYVRIIEKSDRHTWTEPSWDVSMDEMIGRVGRVIGGDVLRNISSVVFIENEGEDKCIVENVYHDCALECVDVATIPATVARELTEAAFNMTMRSAFVCSNRGTAPVSSPARTDTNTDDEIARLRQQLAHVSERVRKVESYVRSQQSESKTSDTSPSKRTRNE